MQAYSSNQQEKKNSGTVLSNGTHINSYKFFSVLLSLYQNIVLSQIDDDDNKNNNRISIAPYGRKFGSAGYLCSGRKG